MEKITNSRRKEVAKTTLSMYLAETQEKKLQENIKKLVKVKGFAEKLFLKGEE